MTAAPSIPGAAGTIDVPLALALADEMVALTSSLADLAYDLGSEPETLRRHMASLQTIDEITQRQIAIAEVLRSDAAIPDRFGAITLHTLGTSLEKRYKDYGLKAAEG